ncbi:alkaline phosphatase family protein [Flavivirga eckloniae]|uniref:PA14 domain-containing protein n=1 Tax=Flavivirga eckloniae TaxID=1803846 RepID=A0A2K9PU25_9FLAO|nr:alkaline phosphatase family protein [Flavivirga eckloniae]AUP80561.1 hypothetical protein C1H87_18320 [Flavivirga eckloniae]
MNYFKYLIMTIGFFSLWSCSTKKTSKETQKAKHVVVIGFDGLSPDGLKHANTPTFDKLMQEGAYSLQARAVLPTSSSTNWASMIMGVGPEQHGITSNSWDKHNLVLPTVAQSEDFFFPSIFHLIDTQIENAEIGVIYHWKEFGRLFEKNTVDYDVNSKTEDETAALASEYIKTKNPTFTFVHFDHIDHAGHEYGHGTDHYYESVEKADSLLAVLINTIKTSDIANETMVIVSSDHGGLGKGHGGESLQEVEIPFIIWGKSVKKDYKITAPVYQYDNAATVAHILNLKKPFAWIGRPVKHAFEGFNETVKYPVTERLEPPVILPKSEGYKKAGGLFNNEVTVTIENLNTVTGDIFYTTDGSLPTKASKKYNTPFSIKENTVLKSAFYINGKISSVVSEAFFRIKDEDYKAPIHYDIFYSGNDLANIPSIRNKKPDVSGSCFEMTSEEIKEKVKKHSTVRFTTNITITEEGKYTFYTRSDDGSKLWINDDEVVNNDGDHGVKERKGSVHLKPGVYPLTLTWFNGEGGFWLDTYYKSNTINKQMIPTTILSSN